MNARRAAGRLLCVTVVCAAATGVVRPTASAGQTIHACYQKEGGQLRLLLTGQCKKSEWPFTWNAQGPKGDKGDKGDMGQPGPAGAMGQPGPAGISNVERFDFSSEADSLSPKKAFAECKHGTVVGGGAQVFIAGDAEGPVALKTSHPSKELNGWAATAEEMNPTGAKWFVTAFALCATVAP